MQHSGGPSERRDFPTLRSFYALRTKNAQKHPVCESGGGGKVCLKKTSNRLVMQHAGYDNNNYQ